MAEEFIYQLHVTGPDMDRKFKVPEGRIIFGREESSTLMLKHSLVSRKHAKIERANDTVQLTDLGSANGTLLNNEKVTANAPMPLADGSVIQIGPYQLTFNKVRPEPVAITPSQDAVPDDGLPEPPQLRPEPERPEPPIVPAGLSTDQSRYLEYLPGIYHTKFMTNFMALLESVYVPIEWNVDNFDLYLDPKTTPADFLPWLNSWFGLTFDSTWSKAQQRQILADAHQIYARRGTKWALSRVLEIYTGQKPEILDTEEDLKPFTFTVQIPLAQSEVKATLVEQLIDSHKPAHTSYKLRFKKG